MSFQVSNQSSKHNLIVNKQTFDTMKLMQEKDDTRSMYDLIYRRGKNGASRLSTFSYAFIVTMPEVLRLVAFTTVFTT